MMEIRAKCRRLKQRHDLKLVVIDYLQLMSCGKRVESRQQEVSEFSRAMKLLAKELEVPVIAICQLNRGPEQRSDKRPQLSDLRESGAIEQDADMVILLHREDLYERESPRAGEADFIVAKHRNGPTGEITVAFRVTTHASSTWLRADAPRLGNAEGQQVSIRDDLAGCRTRAWRCRAPRRAARSTLPPFARAG